MNFSELYEIGSNILELLDKVNELLCMKMLVLKTDRSKEFFFIGNTFDDTCVEISETLYDFLKRRNK